MSTNIPILKMTVGAFLVRLVLILIVTIWTLPTLGLFISSLRDKDLLLETGWWKALTTTERSLQGRTGVADDQSEGDGIWVLSGNILEDSSANKVTFWSLNVNDPREMEAGEVLQMTQEIVQDGDETKLIEKDFVVRDGEEIVLREDEDVLDEDDEAIAAPLQTFTVDADGNYQWTSAEPFEIDRGRRFLYIAEVPPTFSLDNYREVLESAGIDRSFINTFTVTIPATIIPIAIAATAAYAFSWMEFAGRRFLFAVVVGLLVVPLQLSLIPLLKLYNNLGIEKGYPGIWMAHTGFGLPLAIYLLRNYIGGLPRELIESAQIDGASHFQIFTRLVMPLSVPALASFAIFQFLWVWNDLLVALVFLTKREEQIVMTSRLTELIGSQGDNWEILTSSAFISIIVPILVFFALQRYFVRGLLAGSVKGG